MSGPVNHEDFPGAERDAVRSAPASDGDDADAYYATLPPWAVAHETISRAGSAGPPAPRTPVSFVDSAEATGERPRGVPQHVGDRPPSYPSHPLSCPGVRDGDGFAAFTPAVVLDGAQTGPLTVRAASIRGDSHNWEGSCRQDAMTVTRIGPPEAELLLLAVADGLGSAKSSHLGSYRVTRQTAVHLDREAESIHAALSAQDDGELRAIANKAIAGAVGELHLAQDQATTLHVLLIPTDVGIRERAVFSVGDGGLFRLRGGRWEHGSPVGEDNLLDTRTEALPHAYRSVKCNRFQTVPGEILLLGTDGVTNPLTQKDPEFARHLADAWGGPEIPSLSDFLWQAQTRAKSYDDDRTVICVWEGDA
ncbi:protein phosphatase 2C domain-containing protein [Streptomyces sp. L2]|uniref:protein phosphatase 2C domain-containing protein n=1 Tax=Streptomyces sp. L2 TaxID=2162665 RepID=UPI0010126366|nr:protein phosphatase 2C domain-containing protein [Streptomyces sp. L2]